MFGRFILLMLIGLLLIDQGAFPKERIKTWIESVDCITQGKLKNYTDPKKFGVQLPPDSVKEEIVLHLEGKYPDMVTVFMDLKEGLDGAEIKPTKANYKVTVTDGKLSIRFAKSTLQAANVYWINLVIKYEDKTFEVEKFPLYISNPVR